MKFKLLILNYLTIFSITAFSQSSNIDNLKNVIPPSPNASAIAKYTEWPVNLYTGLPNIEIPICELKGRSISLPISISYHSGGNKVGDIASWIGLGWSLNVGGIISRGVRGYPDEDITVGYFAKRQLYNNQNDICTNPVDLGISKQHKVGVAKGEQDAEQDIYNFSALGKSFKFFFRADGTIVPMPYNNVKITTNFMTGQSNSSGFFWIVLLEDGTKLEFGGNGFEELNKSSRFDIGSHSFPTSWLLKKIISTTGEEILFTYNVVEIQQDSYFSETDAIKYSISTIVGSPNQCPLYLEGDKKKPSSEKQEVNMLQVSTIESETSRIEFLQNSTERQDLKGGRKLDGIKVYSKIHNKYLSHYSFNHAYSIATTSNEHLNGILSSDLNYYRKRLKLLSLEKRDPATNTIENTWKFNYNNQNLPSRRSYAQDHWGFYNGAVSNTTLVPNFFYPFPQNVFQFSNNAGFNPSSFNKGGNREGNADFARAEMMESIEYPTGGKTTFYYEGNTISVNEEQFSNNTLNATSLSLSSFSNPYINTTEVTFSISVRQNIRLNMTSYISNGIFNDNPNARVSAQIIKIGQANSCGGIINGIGVSNFTGQVYFNLLEAGTYILRLSTNAVHESFGSNDAVTASCSVNFEQSLGFQNISKNTGGLRLNRMSIYDGVNPYKNIDKFFVYENPLIINPIDYKSMYFSEYEETNCEPNGMTCTYKVVNRTSSTRFSFGDIQGGSVGYGKVTTLLGLNGVNGKIVSEFTNEQDLGLSEAIIFPFPPTDPRPWRRGQLINQTDYSAMNLKLKSINKGYDYTSKYNIHSFKAAFMSRQQCQCTDIDGDCFIQKICYTTTSEQVKEVFTTTTLYDENGVNPANTIITNYYDNPNNCQPTRIETTDSKGLILKAITKSPLEKNEISNLVTLNSGASTAIDSMLARNIITLPLMEEKYLGTRLISRSLLNYKNWSTSILALENIQTQKGNNPLETRIHFNKYDNKGNLLEQQKADNIVESYVWGYHQTYPVAKIIGANYDEVLTALGKTDANLTYLQILNSNDLNFQLSILRNNLKISNPIAQMTTYTYEPLVGITSQTDVNNRITYYEYDGFNRLLHIRDEENNILKKYCYNYAGQPIDCKPTNRPNIYAKLSYTYYPPESWGGVYGNVVVNFYSNEACTQPLNVTNLALQYNYYFPCYESSNYSLSPLNVVANGTSVTLASNQLLQYWDTKYINGEDVPFLCNNVYTVLNSDSYNIVR